MPAGAPSDYTKELGEEICLKISTSSYGIKRLCAENPHWPCKQTIFEWRLKIKEFGDLYAKAKQSQVECLVDDSLDIADDTDRDTLIKQNKDGEDYEVCNTEWINRSRLRVDTRKWLAAKLAPRIYGDNAALVELAQEMKELKERLAKEKGHDATLRPENDA